MDKINSIYYGILLQFSFMVAYERVGGLQNTT